MKKVNLSSIRRRKRERCDVCHNRAYTLNKKDYVCSFTDKRIKVCAECL